MMRSRFATAQPATATNPKKTPLPAAKSISKEKVTADVTGKGSALQYSNTMKDYVAAHGKDKWLASTVRATLIRNMPMSEKKRRRFV